MKNLLTQRRQFIKMGLTGLGLFVSGGLASVSRAEVDSFQSLFDLGPLQEPDENGIRLPRGFKSRVVARSSQQPVATSSYQWHAAPDGGACYPVADGGWVYVSNSELTVGGGAGALRFDAQGQVIDAYPILENTSRNCAGGATPWGTWLSCEEHDNGKVFECDPLGQRSAVVRPMLGTFQHEAAAFDAASGTVYLTEDKPDGCLYRFVAANDWPDLDAGHLEVACVVSQGGRQRVEWQTLPDPEARDTATRYQVAAATPFAGGEGIAFHDGVIYFSTKRDNKVWAYDTQSSELTVLYDVATSTNPILSGVDNVVITPAGDVLVAEDGGDMQIVALIPGREPLPLLHIIGQDGSEICGPAFDPSFSRLYFSSQRGVTGQSEDGITYEISLA